MQNAVSLSLNNWCYSAPQRSARCASSKNQKGATSMKQLTSALNNWWWRDANPVGRR